MDENLIGLPASDKGIVKKADRENWVKRQREGVKGKTFEYHYSSFPIEIQKQLGFSMPKEWFSANELKDFAGMPNSPQGVNKRARTQHWEKRERDGVQGGALEYHVSSLPPSVQKDLGFYPTETRTLVPDIAETVGRYVKEAINKATELVSVPFYKTFASAGFGAFNDDVYEPDDFVGLSARWLQQRGLQKNKLAFILTSGDSMTPTIHHGDMLLINRAVTTPRDGQIYVIRSGDQLWVKRVQGIPGGIRLISDNKEIYAPIELKFEDNLNFEVLGQVVFIGHDLI